MNCIWGYVYREPWWFRFGSFRGETPPAWDNGLETNRFYKTKHHRWNVSNNYLVVSSVWCDTAIHPRFRTTSSGHIGAYVYFGGAVSSIYVLIHPISGVYSPQLYDPVNMAGIKSKRKTSESSADHEIWGFFNPELKKMLCFYQTLMDFVGFENRHNFRWWCPQTPIRHRWKAPILSYQGCFFVKFPDLKTSTSNSSFKEGI